jgi:hypothetical protein
MRQNLMLRPVVHLKIETVAGPVFRGRRRLPRRSKARRVSRLKLLPWNNLADTAATWRHLLE